MEIYISHSKLNSFLYFYIVKTLQRGKDPSAWILTIKKDARSVSPNINKET